MAIQLQENKQICHSMNIMDDLELDLENMVTTQL